MKDTTRTRVTVQRDRPDEPLSAATEAALDALAQAAAGQAFNRPFPIMGPRGRKLLTVPWATAERARERAEAALGITLERIAALGGLEARELLKFLDPSGDKSRRNASLAQLEAMVAEQVGDQP